MWNEICPRSRQRTFHICEANISQRSYFTCPQGKFRWKKHAFACFFLVGDGGFGPPKLNSSRFTVCPLWPLGKSPMMELVIGVEPTTCWLQISCSAIEPHQHSLILQRVTVYHNQTGLSRVFFRKNKKIVRRAAEPEKAQGTATAGLTKHRSVNKMYIIN